MRPTTRREKIRTTKPNGFRGGGGHRLQFGLAVPALRVFRYEEVCSYWQPYRLLAGRRCVLFFSPSFKIGRRDMDEIDLRARG